MTPLPPGKKPLLRILAQGDAADRVVDLVTLLEHGLCKLPGEAGGELPGSARERVDRHRELFAPPYPTVREVHAAITVRNALTHANGDGPTPTAEEIRAASAHLEGAVRAVASTVGAADRREVLGGRDFALAYAAIAFLGLWQVVFFVLRLLMPADLSAAATTDVWIVLALIGPLHVYALTLLARLVRGMSGVLRVASWAWLGALLPLARVLLEVIPAGDLRRSLEPAFRAVGTGFEYAAQVLGSGVWAFAPWALPLREGVWSRLEGRTWLFALVIALPIVSLVAWRWTALRPSRAARRVEGGRHERLGRVLAIALGAALIGERVLAFMAG